MTNCKLQVQKQEQHKGLYQTAYEHDACGVGMVVNIHGGKSHELVDHALKVLENMEHRGAETRDKTGDGAGIMVQIPHEFILLQGIPVPEKGTYGTGLVFLPKDEQAQQDILSVMIEEIEREGLQLMHLRTVPTNPEVLGAAAREVEPDIKQIFVKRGLSPVPSSGREGGDYAHDEEAELNRKLYIIRKKIERRIDDKDFYICSLSSKNIIYKGMLTSGQLRRYFPDLSNDYFTSGLALVHSRFSTNTFPTWSLAQPFRLLAHNGEINTIRGNRGWMKARESVLSSEALGDIKGLSPIVQEGMSDSASLDNVFEFLMMSGLSLPQAMAILVPESFNDKNPISEDLKAFYEYHSILMEPWDGPAALLFSDGRYAGGMLDRNGLRPSRYTITKQGLMVVASEVGVMDFEPGDVVAKGRLQPGKILLVDTQEGRIYYDGEIKEQLAKAHPYREWLNENRVQLEKLKSGRKVDNSVSDLGRRLVQFGYGQEDIDKTIIPMATAGQEPVAAMGNDTPLAVISDRPQVLFNYFRQQFAQVTNPAIDPIREELVMSLTEYIGAVGTNILTPDASNCKMVRLPQPILTNTQLDILCNIRYKGFKTIKLPMTFSISPNRAEGDYAQAGEDLRAALDKLCKDAEKAVDDGYNYIILTDKCDLAPLSDWRENGGEAYIPSLLAVSAVHHYLINVGKRVQTALIVESGEIRETMHAALLLGYGASALCPYMTFAILDDLVKHNKIQEEYATAEAHYIKAVDKGLKKIMSKMGISTIRSYRGAKIFESIGLGEDLLRRYFGTEVSTIGGIGLKEIARDALRLQAESCSAPTLKNNGLFAWRKDGIKHAWNPETIAKLQLATRQGSYEKFKEWEKLVDEKESPIFIRDFFSFKRADKPTPIDEVESVESIVKHFVTGAMSFGALSIEAHEALALAMNKLGARSNTGEGGEDNARYHTEVDGVSLSSKTKQIASRHRLHDPPHERGLGGLAVVAVELAVVRDGHRAGLLGDDDHQRVGLLREADGGPVAHPAVRELRVVGDGEYAVRGRQATVPYDASAVVERKRRREEGADKFARDYGVGRDARVLVAAQRYAALEREERADPPRRELHDGVGHQLWRRRAVCAVLWLFEVAERSYGREYAADLRLEDDDRGDGQVDEQVLDDEGQDVEVEEEDERGQQRSEQAHAHERLAESRAPGALEYRIDREVQDRDLDYGRYRDHCAGLPSPTWIMADTVPSMFPPPPASWPRSRPPSAARRRPRARRLRRPPRRRPARPAPRP